MFPVTSSYSQLLLRSSGTTSAMGRAMETTTKIPAKLLSEVTPMIQGLAKRLASGAGGSVDRDDLFQVGMMRATYCAASYNPNGGASFATWCYRAVGADMRRARNASRSTFAKVARFEADSVSLSTPIGESENTLEDILPDSSATAEVRVAQAQREAQVRAIVARVRAEHRNPAMFDDLIERLMSSTFKSQERNRSEVSLSDIAAKHGISRQGAHVNEKSLRARLEEALAEMEAE